MHTLTLMILAGCSRDTYGLGDGSDPVTEPVDLTAENMIDDLEDGDGSIIEEPGRTGAWYTYNDGAEGSGQSPAEGTEFLPAEGGANDSAYAANTSGSGFTDWGAAMAFDINTGEEGAKGVFDGSSYTGIAIMARGNTTMRASIATVATTATEYDGDCEPGSGEGEECDDAFGVNLNLSDEWAQYVLPFDSVTQDGWGQPASFDASTILGMQFSIADGGEFDIWVDDVGFYE